MRLSDSLILQAIRRWISRNSVPLTVFVASRIGLYLLAYFSLVFLPMSSDPGVWQVWPENLFLDGWVRWDSGWYKDIATQGYTNIPISAEEMQGQRDTVFFPLYPILVRAMTTLVQDTFLAGLLISNIAFLVALILLFRLVSNHYGPEVARRSIILLSVYPFSFYFGTMYTESLFLLAVVCAFYYGERGHWLKAGLSAAAAGATRSIGFITIIALAILYLEQIHFKWNAMRPNALWLALGLLAPGSYMTFLAMHFGDPWLFIKGRYAKGWQADVDIGLLRATLRSVLSLRTAAMGNYPALNLIHLAVCLLALILCGIAWRKLQPSYTTWSTLMTLASAINWPSMGRYAAVIFPLFVTASLTLEDERWYWGIVYISTLMLALFTVMYTHFYWVS